MDRAYTLEVSIREQSSATSNNGPATLPSGLGKSFERNLGREDASLLWSVCIFLLGPLHGEVYETAILQLEVLKDDVDKGNTKKKVR
jgi:hypothetical protein